VSTVYIHTHTDTNSLERYIYTYPQIQIQIHQYKHSITLTPVEAGYLDKRGECSFEKHCEIPEVWNSEYQCEYAFNIINIIIYTN